MMTKGSQIYPIIKVVCVVLFAVGGLIVINGPTFGFASPSSGRADQSATKMQLDEAIKALQAGDTASAETHAQMAQDNL